MPAGLRRTLRGQMGRHQMASMLDAIGPTDEIVEVQDRPPGLEGRMAHADDVQPVGGRLVDIHPARSPGVRLEPRLDPRAGTTSRASISRTLDSPIMR